MKHPTDRFGAFRHVLAPIHADGWRFIAIAAVVTLILFFVWQPLGWIGVVITVWVAYFFRDPWRVSPQRADLVLAPADGQVVEVALAPPPAALEMGDTPMLRIAIFLSLLDVHINRMPIGGRVKKLAYRKGSFRSASDPEASSENECMAIRLTTEFGLDIALTQIAGLVARRIVCNATEGQQVIAGQRFGLIRFGSRAEIYLPASWTPLVLEGQHTIGGETIIAEAGTATALGPGVTH